MVQVILQRGGVKGEKPFHQSREEGVNLCDIGNESDPLSAHPGLTFKAGDER